MRRLAVALYVALMCGLFAFLAAESQPLKSLTIDETVYIPVGIQIARHGDFTFNPEQPPVPKLLAGWGARRLDLDVAEPFDIGSFLRANSASIEQWTLAARRPMIALGILTLLGILAFAWQARGMHAGLFAMTLAALSPNLLAHGRLVTGDLPVACFGIWVGFFFLRWMTHRRWADLAGLGVAFGLALGSKYTAVLFPAFLLVGGTIGGWVDSRGDDGSAARSIKREAWTALVGIGGMTLIAAPVVFALYGFQTGPLGQLLESDGLRSAQDQGNSLIAWIYTINLPAPSFWHGLLKAMARGDGEYAYLLGDVSYTGWWYYYPICLLVKLPIGLLAATAAVGILSVLRRHPVGRPAILAWTWIIGLLGFFSAGNVDLGLRYLLPMIPFVYVVVGSLGSGDWTRSRLRVSLLLLLLVSQAGAVFSVRPDYLAFFNSIAGGPEGGRRWLADSNLDWGQDLIGLRDVLEAEGIERPYLAVSGNVNPEYYGIAYLYLPSPFYRRTPRPGDMTQCVAVRGWVVVGATNLAGVFNDPRNCYEWVTRHSPAKVVGNTTFLYHFE